ncbi:hypothetical protein WG66_015440, partial [Moniliophthora roreri]
SPVNSFNVLERNLQPVQRHNSATSCRHEIGWRSVNNIPDAASANWTRFIGDAHSRGIKARFYNTSGWPFEARNRVWRQLLTAGADWLNIDDLPGASFF